MEGRRMTGPVYVAGDVWIPERELTGRYSRPGGPCGQSVNTADIRVQLSLDVARSPALGEALGEEARSRAVRRLGRRLVDGVLTVTASEHRSQWRNRVVAEQRL